MIVRDYDSKNVLKDLIRVLERASFETCAFIEIRLELREINELLTELYKIPDTNGAEPQTETQTETQNSNLTFEKDECAKEYEELGLKELKALIEADRKDEPTISKMEQVDKDINVRSKDEPQTDCAWGKCDD